MRQAVCREVDLEPGAMTEVHVGGVSIALLRKSDGSFHALRNRCPHQGGALANGWLEPMVVGTGAGEIALSEGRVVVRCPLHHWEFDADTGLSPADAQRFRVRVYPVSVEDGLVYVDRAVPGRLREKTQ